MKIENKQKLILHSNQTTLASNKKKSTKKSDYRSSIFHNLFHRGQEYTIRGHESDSFNRRTYELPIQSLQSIKKDTLGMTNNILMLKNDQSKSIQLFIPAYVSLKVKSIQKIQIKDLIAEINSVLIIIILIEGLSDQIKKLLQEHVMVQVNRGDSFQLKVSDDSTKIKKKQQGNFLKFIVRDVFPVQIYDDVFLSPFQILNLVLTVTVNSIFTPKQCSPVKGYKCQISFNCMRNPQKISISYVSECRLGVYDLAEKKLMHYPSNLATYDEIKSQFIDFVQGRKKRLKSKRSQDKKQIKKDESIYNICSKTRYGEERLQLKSSVIERTYQQKIRYFEYSHFVIPVYKFPGNAWATIFIPVFMLSLLSTSLFFYKASPIQKLGTIATIVLGFIALIPSIKDQLPPSQKITLSQIIVYVQTVNCMLSLAQNIFQLNRSRNIWKNNLFLFSVLIHLTCIGISLSLLIIHKFWWEKSYNTTEKAQELSPINDKQAWNNPYCDQYFLRYNQSQKKNKIVKFKDFLLE